MSQSVWAVPPRDEALVADTTARLAATNRGALSIEQKLPLIIGALLLAVTLALSTAAYMEVRRTSVAVASERLSSITSQFRDLFQQSGVQLRAQIAATSTKPAVSKFAKTRDLHVRAAALAELQYKGPNPDQVVATELRDANGRVLLTTATDDRFGIANTTANDLLPRAATGDSAVVGSFRSVRDTIVYPIAKGVPGTDAYVFQWRRLAGSRRAREQM